MAKRKTKTTSKSAAPRRTSRRGKQAATQGETSAASETTNQEPPSEPPPLADDTDPQASTSATDQSDPLNTIPCQVPVVATHKKFGKYRCLFNTDDPFTKKYEMGSDSETSNSMDIKVLDPCAGSESDSNALDTQSDTNSGPCYSPSALALQGGSRDISPVAITRESGPGIPFLTDSDQSESILSLSNHMDGCNEEQKIESPEINEPLDVNTDSIPLPEEQAQHEENADIPLEEQIMYEDAGDDDDEIITVVQIVEDDHPELYYDIKIDSPKNSEQNEDQNEVQNGEQDQDQAQLQQNEIQKHFQSLNLATASDVPSPMDFIEVIDITTPPCTTPDLYQKEEAVNRPDPSITPSSTLSDDSNSSRVTEQNQNDSAESSPSGVRRSSRIKTISNLKQKTKGYGLVKTPLKKALITQTKLKLEELGSDSQDKSTDLPPNSPSFPVPSEMPVKVKSRWRRSSELEMVANSPTCSPLASPSLPTPLPTVPETVEEPVPLSKEAYDRIIKDRLDQYQHLEENEYLCERMISKDTKKMICDCFMTKEELERGELACGEDCLNRLLMIECNSRCPVGDRCTNRRFQKRENGPLKVFYADKKGCGVEAARDIPMGEFLMEYIGEVLDYEQFYKRAQTYSDENNLHHYFMSLKGETVIDATLKGNISRFINHSCEPNAETQKWTVNGELRIGFFSKRDIVSGEEITFDYQFQRFGKVAQRCFCGAENCRGWIGAEPDSDDEDYEEEEEDVSTSKSGTTDASEESTATATEVVRPRPRRSKKDRKYKPKADLVQDADIEEDLEALSRTGVKNQSHTLRLSRTVVRAKSRPAQVALLRLLRDADLPCRRLFLDYRGLRLLAPWCADAPLDFKLEMLQTIDRLPIPNKSMVQESRFFTIIERWTSSVDTPAEQVFIDEATGLPIDILNRGVQDSTTSPDKLKESAAMLDKVKDLSSQLLERWSSLKEVFKIPKKERIQQMKEHERQANVERRAADSSGSRDRDRDRRDDRERRDERERDRDREKERERDRERERERERDRDRYRERDREREREKEREERDRRRRKSPDGRRSIRLSERVLAAVPPMSKEERRRAFAEAAAAADESRRQRDVNPMAGYPFWPHHEQFQQMFPPGMMGPNNMPMMMPGSNMMPGNNMIPGNMPPGNMLPGNMPPGNMMPGNMLPPGNMMPGTMMPPGNMMPGMMPGMQSEMPPEWMQNAPPFCPPFQPGQPFCMQQPNMMGMAGFGMNVGGFMFGQQMPPGAFPPMQQVTEPQQPEPTLDPVTKEVVLPSMWRSAKDPLGRTYYYHVKLRRPQWLPPPVPPSPEDSSSEEEEEQVNTFDSPIVRRQMEGSRFVEGLKGICEVSNKEANNGLIPDHALLSIRPRKRRPGLVSERPISPRTEEDKLAGRLEVKRYKQTKEKLRRRKEKQNQKVRVASSRKFGMKMVDLIDSDSDTENSPEEEVIEKPVPLPSPIPSPEVIPIETTPVPVIDVAETTRKIKEQFRSSMARVMVGLLSPYRRTDAPSGKITCTADFKHLARKLTHFVMLKELKHCRSVEELIVTDSVKSKAKTFTKKYMTKFGPVYTRPADEAD